MVSRKPQHIDGPAAWHGKDVANDRRWRRPLSATVIAEIDEALERARRAGLDWRRANTQTFPLPGLAGMLAEVAHELEEGLGMVRMEGLPVERYSLDDLRCVLFGLAAHLGTPVYQNARGEIMGEIADEGADVGTRRGQVRDPATGGVFLSSRSRAQSTAELRWHTDRCDLVGLLCVNSARVGGTSRLASAATVNNLMLERRPDLAALLYEDIPRSRLGEEIGGEDCYYPLPVFAAEGGRFSSHYSRTFVEAAQKNPGVPRMSHAQWEALDMLAEIATEVGFEMSFRPGDIQFLNNHVIYHGRTPFEDFPEPERKRRLLRVWLSARRSRRLPPGFEVLWGATEPGAIRGGMCQNPLPGPGLQSSSSDPRERVPQWLLPVTGR